MTFTPPEVYQEVEQRAGGLCEAVWDGVRCCSPGDWRGLQRHHNPHRSQVPRNYVYKTDQVKLVCGPCHDKLLGERKLL